MDPSREHELQQHGRLLPPTGRMYFPPAEGVRSGGPPAVPSYEGALPPPPLPPGAAGHAAIPFDYGGGGGSADEQERSGQYAAVPFSYAAAEPAHEDAAEVAAEVPQGQQQPPADDAPFVPPFPVPEALRGRLPAGRRQYRVMRQTAAFVREGGPQLEVLLRVRRAGDPVFAFLDPADALHPFYRWVAVVQVAASRRGGHRVDGRRRCLASRQRAGLRVSGSRNVPKPAHPLLSVLSSLYHAAAQVAAGEQPCRD
jgi:hypothetical protein